MGSVEKEMNSDRDEGQRCIGVDIVSRKGVGGS